MRGRGWVSSRVVTVQGWTAPPLLPCYPVENHYNTRTMPHANDGAEALPPIAALFLVVFDQKIG